jgi:hypothetical protein
VYLLAIDLLGDVLLVELGDGFSQFDGLGPLRKGADVGFVVVREVKEMCPSELVEVEFASEQFIGTIWAIPLEEFGDEDLLFAGVEESESGHFLEPEFIGFVGIFEGLGVELEREFEFATPVAAGGLKGLQVWRYGIDVCGIHEEGPPVGREEIIQSI